MAGFNDGGNLLAAATAGRTVAPGIAFVIISLGALAGPLLAGSAVAVTMGHGIVDYQQAGFVVLAGSITGGMLAVLLAYAFRVPTTASVAVVSSALGSLWVRHQLGLVVWSGVLKLCFALLGSMIAGFLAGFVAYTIAWIMFSKLNLRTGHKLMRLSYLSIALEAIGYGSNDAEKMMGLMVAATLLASGRGSFVVPLWIIVTSVAAFAAGMALGGIRVAKTVGGKLFRIRPLHALCFQLSSAATVLLASAFGGPLSTTQTTASAILGVGAATNPRAVRWSVARGIVATWLLTAPAGAAFGALATLVLQSLIRGR